VVAPIKVAVVDEHEIFRRGLVACLAEDPGLEVTADPAPAPSDAVAVVSPRAARRRRFPCPLVVCAPDLEAAPTVAPGNVVAGVLPRATLTSAQLHATVRAAAAGLRVNADAYAGHRGDALDGRATRVLELLAAGRTTREIATATAYSERTVKKQIHDLEERLHARSRAQAVAQAIRQGLI